MKKLLFLLLFIHSFVYASLTHDTPRRVADTNNNIIWIWESKPFGETKPDEDPDSDNNTFTLNLRFPGQYYDKETDTHYNINRDYNPLTGRYMQSDPIGFDGGVNTYLYVNANPLGNVDESGLCVDESAPVYDKIAYGVCSKSILIVPEKLINSNQDRNYGIGTLIYATNDSVSMVDITLETDKTKFIEVGVKGNIGKIYASEPFNYNSKSKKFTFVKLGFNTFVAEGYFRIGHLEVIASGFLGGISGSVEIGKSGMIGGSLGIGGALKWDWVDF